MYKFELGATLLEMVVTLFVVSILVGTVFTLTTNSMRVSETIGGTIVSDFTAKFFIDTFVDDVASASNITPKPAIWINDNPVPTNAIATSGTNWTIKIFSMIPATTVGTATADPAYSQLITYKIQPYPYDPNNKASMIQRQTAYPNEVWILKNKTLYTGSTPDTGTTTGPPLLSGGYDVFKGDDNILLKVKSFTCKPSVKNYIGGLECTLTMFGPIGGNSSNYRVFKFYADAKNQP